MKTKAVVINKTGGSDTLEYTEVTLPEPKNDQIQIDHKTIGLNFIDIYFRSGVYPVQLPTGLGMEGAGVVTAVGSEVKHLKIGDRVAYASNQMGSYCQSRIMSATHVCKLPDEISFKEGAAIMLKGLTVEYLFHRTTAISAGDTVLFHAAAGGVGLIACQWARSEGINLIGTASTDEKCDLALSNGATHMINYKKENFKERVLELTGKAGVPIVMDSIGKDTFEASLDCLQPLGMMISFGNTTGKVPPFDIGMLQARGSLKITRPTLFNPHMSSYEDCQKMTKNLFEKVLSKQINIIIGQTYSFDDIPNAHKALEAGFTTGSTIIEV